MQYDELPPLARSDRRVRVGELEQLHHRVDDARDVVRVAPPVLVYHARLDYVLLEIERRVHGVGDGRLAGGLELEVAQRREELHREEREFGA